MSKQMPPNDLPSHARERLNIMRGDATQLWVGQFSDDRDECALRVSQESTASVERHG